jgi:hypothetical protein
MTQSLHSILDFFSSKQSNGIISTFLIAIAVTLPVFGGVYQTSNAVLLLVSEVITIFVWIVLVYKTELFKRRTHILELLLSDLPKEEILEQIHQKEMEGWNVFAVLQKIRKGMYLREYVYFALKYEKNGHKSPPSVAVMNSPAFLLCGVVANPREWK